MRRHRLSRQVSGYSQTSPWGAVLGCIPPSRFTLRLRHACAAQPSSLVASGSAFRRLHRGHKPAPPTGLDRQDGCRISRAGRRSRATPAGLESPMSTGRTTAGFGPRCDGGRRHRRSSAPAALPLVPGRHVVSRQGGRSPSRPRRRRRWMPASGRYPDGGR